MQTTSTDTNVMRVGTLEGKPVYGGELEVKLRVRGEEMVLLEVFYATGVGTPLHSHTHEIGHLPGQRQAQGHDRG